MSFQRVLDIAKEQSREWPEDIEEATRSAEKRIRNLRGFKAEIQPVLITRAIRELVYNCRHQDNKDGKNGNGAKNPNHQPYGSQTGGTIGAAAVNAMYCETLLGTFKIDGRLLKNVFGKELKPLAEKEWEGHQDNARMLELLLVVADKVPEDQRVGEVIDDARFQQMWDALAKRKDKKKA